MKDGKLNLRRQRFVAAYVETMNASEAVRQVWPRIKDPNVYGARMLAIDSVQDAVVKLNAERLMQNALRTDDVLTALQRIGYSSIVPVMEIMNPVIASQLREKLTAGESFAIKKLTYKTRVELVPGKEEEGQDSRVVQISDVAIEMHDKMGALGMLAKYLGLLPASGGRGGVGPLVENQQNNFYLQGNVSMLKLFQNIKTDELVKMLGLPEGYMDGPPAPEPTDGEDE